MYQWSLFRWNVHITHFTYLANWVPLRTGLNAMYIWNAYSTHTLTHFSINIIIFVHLHTFNFELISHFFMTCRDFVTEANIWRNCNEHMHTHFVTFNDEIYLTYISLYCGWENSLQTMSKSIVNIARSILCSFARVSW